MCNFMPTFQTPPNILKEEEGGGMGMNRGEWGGESLVELEKKDKNCRHIIKNVKIQAVCAEKLKHYIVL